MRRELFLLLATVLAVDALFIAGYYILRLEAAGDPFKIGYAVAWTSVTLVVVLRGLTRVRRLRGSGGWRG